MVCESVSYTHLDVYKRQVCVCVCVSLNCAITRSTKCRMFTVLLFLFCPIFFDPFNFLSSSLTSVQQFCLTKNYFRVRPLFDFTLLRFSLLITRTLCSRTSKQPCNIFNFLKGYRSFC